MKLCSEVSTAVALGWASTQRTACGSGETPSTVVGQGLPLTQDWASGQVFSQHLSSVSRTLT